MSDNKQLAVVNGLLQKKKQRLESSLGRAMPVDQFMSGVLTTLQMNPFLLKCTPVTIYRSVLTATTLNLAVNNVLGHAYLVPYKNNRAGTWECQLVVGYRGFMKLAMQSEQKCILKPYIVYDGDEFLHKGGSKPELVHTPRTTAERGDAPIIGAYCVASMKDGRSTFEFMDIDEIHACRDRSQAYKNGKSPWNDPHDYKRMVAKTPIRLLGSRLDLSPELTRASSIEDHLPHTSWTPDDDDVLDVGEADIVDEDEAAGKQAVGKLKDKLKESKK